jgi:hypothetical protein
MRRIRTILTMTLVATALCADRAATAAPQLRPQVADVARQVVQRLTVSFQRTLPAVCLHQPHQRGAALHAIRPPAPAPAHIRWMPFSPFQFRLPPPLA